MYSDFRSTLIYPDPKNRGMRGPAVPTSLPLNTFIDNLQRKHLMLPRIYRSCATLIIGP